MARMNRIYRQGIGVVAALVAAAVALALVNRLQSHSQAWTTDPDYLATVKTDFGDIVIRLLTSKAPNTVHHFRQLAESGFYDGLSFHVVNLSQGIIVGGAAPAGEEPKITAPQEDNDLQFDRGAVAMWHPEGQPDHNTSIFMIALRWHPGMSDFYTIFGRVVSGMDVIDRISRVETTGPDGRPPMTPLDRVTIHTITVAAAPSP